MLSFSIEDLGIPRMFAEVLPSLFYYMSLHKSSTSFLPKLNLIDIFNETILKKINDLHTKEELFKVNEVLDISSSNTLINKIAEIITDIQRITVDEKTRAQSTDERVRNMLMLFGMGVDGNPPTGHLVLDDNKDLNLEKSYYLDHPVYNEITNTMKTFAKEIGVDGDNSLIIPLWDEQVKMQITAHPLGGCPMRNDPSEGVVDRVGRVFKRNSESTTTIYYDRLYVVDGSIIPSPLGINPSLTIAALAFRIAEEIAGDKKFWPK